MTSSENAHIASIAVATPPYTADQAEAGKFLAKHFSNKLSSRNKSVMDGIFSHPSIKQRNFAFENPECLVKESQDSRISRFTRWAVELSAEAIVKAVDQANIAMNDISGLVVNTCTGYICPGLSTYLIEKLGLSNRIKAYDLVGSGCGGAIPNIQLAELMLKENNKGIVLSVAVEICSATFQMDDDISLIVSNALFGDGAAAAVIWNRPQGFELISSINYYAPEYRDSIRYIYKNGQLRNQISVKLPHVIRKEVAKVVRDLLKPISLKTKDIKHWALHTGGEKIIDAIKDEIGIEENKLHPSRHILSKYGNMSSPTVLFVAREILSNGVEKGDWCVMVAFGAGLSVHAYLLKKK